MKKVLLLGTILIAFSFVIFLQNFSLERFRSINPFTSNASFSIRGEQNNEEVEFEDIDFVFNDEDIVSRFPNLSDWERPDGPPRVGLQVGHWKNKELPDELERLRERGGGTSGGGKAEWEVNLEIAEKTASLLQDQGIIVDILPATIPVAYWADVFIAIHADGSEDPTASGFKAAFAYGCFRFGSLTTGTVPHLGEWGGRHGSASGQWVSHLRSNCSQDTEAPRFVELLETEYQRATGLDVDGNVSHNMRGYYAFNWRRYEHAVHPMTTAVILETGFLTSPHDRAILISNPDKAAGGISNAVIKFLIEKNLL